jgi:2-polyprenyl-3-methyl-5-hydroxy-6-metoxy-1,4-benzoquinol methylase
MVYVADPPAAEALAELNARYWGVAQGRNRSSDMLHEAQMRSRVAYLESRLGALDGKKLLDVGAGPGALGHALLARGASTALYAVESDPACWPSLRANGARDIWPDLAHCREHGFDLIVLSHVLEHIGDPAGFLRLVGGLLAGNGHLFIEVPNQDYRHKDDFGTHLLSFAPTTLTHLVERAVGLELVDLQTVGPRLESLTRAHAALAGRAPGLKERARRVVPGSIWDAGSRVADRLRSARTSVDAIHATYQLGTYGPEREWIRCLARRPPA